MKRILVVDDSSIMRKNLRAILTKSGYDVVAEATNGLDAYHAYEKHRPDLVTMDVTMPVMDGIQAVKKITEVFPDARIVVISAFDQRSMLFEAMENGAKQYIIKPITAEKLLNVISQVLGEASTQAEVVEAGYTTAATRVEEEPTPSVSIENQNGKFIINMIRKATHRHLDALQNAVQGLLFVKPLHVVLHFGDTEVGDDEVVARIADIIHHIRQADGTVGLVSTHGPLITALRSRQVDVEVSSV